MGGDDLEPDDHGFPHRLFFNLPPSGPEPFGVWTGQLWRCRLDTAFLDTADRQRALAFRAA